jgi:hypothetical protein
MGMYFPVEVASMRQGLHALGGATGLYAAIVAGVNPYILYRGRLGF